MNYILIGRSNVGKSSIFNILASENKNIVHSESGTTRDWHQELIKNSSNYIFDTPGLLIDEKNNKKIFNNKFLDNLKNKINFFLYVIDYNFGFNQIDLFSINQLRRYNKKIILIINKFDNFYSKPTDDFFEYGIDDIVFISCAHSFGFKELNVLLKTSDYPINNKNIPDFSLAIFGKPNAGKSTFLNSLVGYNRSLTSSISGTTSDYVVDYLYFNKKFIKIIDTAGIGKKSKVNNKSVNFFSIQKTFNNISTVDSAIIIINSLECIDRQDKRIIKLVSEKSKSIILVFNKIDLITDKLKFKNDIISKIALTFSEIKNIKFFFISALKSHDVTKIFNYLFHNVYLNKYIISTSKLNLWLKKVVKQNQHPLVENKTVNFKYAVQIKDSPITIKIFCSYSSKLRQNYKKYLINNFNYNSKILTQKTKFIFSSSKNPYV